MQINTKLTIIFLLISLIPIAVISIITTWITNPITTQQVLNHLESVASIQDARVHDWIDNSLEGLSLISSNHELIIGLDKYNQDDQYANKEDMNRVLIEAQSAIDHFKDLEIMNMNGDVVASTNLKTIGTNRFSEDSFIQGSKENTIGMFSLDEDSNLIVQLSGPIYKEGEVIGVLRINCHALNILDVVTDYSGLGETGETVLALRKENGDALFINPLRFDDEAALTRFVPKESVEIPIIQALLGNEKVFTDSIDYRGEQVLAATRYIESVGWGLVVKIDRAEAFAHLATMRNVIILVISACILGIIIAAYYTSRRVTKPIIELTDLAASYTSGELSRKANIYSKDEIGALSIAFNQMTAKLVEANLNLEQKVKERTLDLENDIETRMKVETALAESEKNLRMTFETTREGILTTDAKGRLISINPAAIKMLGYKSDKDLLGIHAQEIWFNPSRRQEVLQSAVGRGYLENIELIFKRNDGKPITVLANINVQIDDKGKIVGTEAFFTDITERKIAEQKIERAAEEWKETFDSIPELISIHDKDFKILRANKTFLEKFKLKANEVVGKACFKIVHGTNEPPPTCPYSKTLNNKKSNSIEYFEPYLGLYLEVTVSPVLDTKGEIIACVHVARDITERKQAEEQIKASLAEKEILLKEVHHRVKNNMQVISSLLKLQSGSVVDEGVKMLFKDSQDRIQSMALVYNKLYQSKDLASINLKNYIYELSTNVLKSYGGSFSKIKIKVDGDDILLVVDQAIPCGLIINEIITNSLKHAFPNGKRGEIRISINTADKDDIEITVSDNGVGIPTSVDIATSETLGLRLINMLVSSQLDGKVDLDRSHGTKFCVVFKKNQQHETGS